MSIFALCAFVVGGLWVQTWSALPPAAALAVPLVLSSGLWRAQRVIAVLLLGVAWAWAYGAWQLNARLPRGLEGVDLTLTGRIANLPERFERGWRFEFTPDAPLLSAWPRRIRLNSYNAALHPKAGEHWQLRVRLKRPHAPRSPGSFDYETWLFSHGIGALGYVRDSVDNQRLASAAVWDSAAWRQSLADRLDSVLVETSSAGLLKALVLGDTSGLSQAHWEVLRRTGTTHLIAISGSHIALIAGWVYFVVRAGLTRLHWQRSPPARAAAFSAIVAAALYSALVDFAIPTRRALCMVTLAFGALALQRHYRVAHVLALALAGVTLLDPLALLTPGCWLSFGAVALILLIDVGRLRADSGWRRFWRINYITALGLAPCLWLFFQQVPLIAPIANLIAIPVLGIVAVPASLLAMLALLSGLDEHGALLHALAAALQSFWPWLESLAAWPWADWRAASPPLWSLLLATLGLACLALPRAWPARWLALFLLGPALTWQAPRPLPGQFELALLDVDQGLAVVVRTAQHTLLFDAGVRWSLENGDMGARVVDPYLRQVGTPRIDTFIVSHDDIDHRGGVDYVLKHWPVGALYGSAPWRWPQAQACLAGQSWQWDSVQFQLLSPTADSLGSDNDRSCVLKVSGARYSALLTGDIEQRAEAELVSRAGAMLTSQVLIAPHHGSRTSSSWAFLQAVAPQWVLIPAGYRNRFGFPHAEVLQRYQQIGARFADSAHSGLLRFDGDGQLHAYRDEARRYWHE